MRKCLTLNQMYPLLLRGQCLYSSTTTCLHKHNCYTDELNFIHGKRSAAKGSQLTNIYPATGVIIGHFQESSSQDVLEAYESSFNAQIKWKNVAPLERGKILQKAAQLLRDDCDFLSYLETMDTGKPLWESRATVLECADSLQMYGGFAATIAGTHVHLPDENFYYTRREPLGVCVGIGAWNFPIQMCVWKSAPALVCGNSMIFKPSPETPQTTVRLAELYIEAGLPPGLFNVIQSSGSAGLTSHPSIRKISFTGSVATARKLTHSVADSSLCPITLELGGKSPLILFEDANLNEALKGVLMANFYSQGEVCSNAARVFVHKSILPQMTDLLLSSVKKFIVGDPMDSKTHMGAMIHQRHGELVLSYIQSAAQEGATILHGGERLVFRNTAFERGFFIPPTILSDCHDDMKAVREEIFGPVLTLLPFEDENEVIHRANKSELGLAAGLFTRDLSRAHRVAGALEAGCVYINTFNVYPPGFPFGGSKSSGFGRENSLDTLHHYMQSKAVYTQVSSIGEVPFPL